MLVGEAKKQPWQKGRHGIVEAWKKVDVVCWLARQKSNRGKKVDMVLLRRGKKVDVVAA